MKDLKELPVVFAMDDNYAAVGGVAIRSVILHSDPRKRYRIYVLHRGIKTTTVKKMEEMGKDHISVECMNLNERNLERIQGFHHSFFPLESTDRILIPELFRQYKKVVYLDCDVIVKIDIAKAFQADLEGYLLGAVRTCAIPGTIKHNQEVLGFTETFKSGALLINTELMCREHVRERCFQLLEEDMQREIPKYTWPDQDVLNIVCKSRVRYFDEEWNFITGPLNPYASAEGTLSAELLKEHLEAAKKCRIIHYTGEMRPWIYPSVPKGEDFWDVARQTEFYEELVIKLNTAMKKRRESFPLYNIKEGSNIILYGAGEMGKRLWTMIMKEHDFCRIVLWVDKDAATIMNRNNRVCEIKEIEKAEYDQIVIAVGNEGVADSIKTDLVKNRGCSENKVVWAFRKR